MVPKAFLFLGKIWFFTWELCLLFKSYTFIASTISEHFGSKTTDDWEDWFCRFFIFTKLRLHPPTLVLFIKKARFSNVQQLWYQTLRFWFFVHNRSRVPNSSNWQDLRAYPVIFESMLSSFWYLIWFSWIINSKYWVSCCRYWWAWLRRYLGYWQCVVWMLSWCFYWDLCRSVLRYFWFLSFCWQYCLLSLL